MLDLAFRDLSFPRLGSGRGADTTAPVASSVSYDTGTDTLTMAVSEACTLYGLHNASATPLTAAAIKSGAEVTQALAAGEGSTEWDDAAWGSGTWYLHVMLEDGDGNQTVLNPIEHVIAAPIVLSEYREAGGFSSSLTLAVGPTNAGDEIIVITYSPTSASPAIANFDVLQTIDGAGRLRAHRWNGTGTRPNNSNVSVTVASSTTFKAASFVIPAATYIGSAQGATASGTSHTIGTTASDAGLTLAAVFGSNDTASYSITGPSPNPSAITAPSSTDVENAIGEARQSASSGFRWAARQHSGPTTLAIETASGSSQTMRYITIALEPTP